MQFDPEKIKAEAVYKLLIGCVVPRPIAWVSTVDADGVKNVAPFSFFTTSTYATTSMTPPPGGSTCTGSARSDVSRATSTRISTRSSR